MLIRAIAKMMAILAIFTMRLSKDVDTGDSTELSLPNPNSKELFIPRCYHCMYITLVFS